ncbi:aldo/keto reductase [Amycolatopsis pithecellobii]|uniref:Aldo/keto reductase n=1 Tax=Amycolatopsis pithecellobii TaxID=664692 RepID=A0A6N7Z6M5_9PSEU|nr:aldo/keto reductase [Amycolatopsis pithecellobii]MTD57599.1 aldo/keto reductase [Amycolatopsis pithecellobii]
MKFRRVGRWGLEVSVIGFGSWPAAAEDDADAARILEHAYDAGVRFFDTANFYQDGHREQLVGRTLSRYPRESYVLATKVSFPIGEPPNNQGLSRKHIVEQCDASLRRLGVDHVDLYQCHRFEPDTPLDETCRTMDDLVRLGKIVYWGVTSWPASGVADAVSLCTQRGWALPISDQEQYSALYRVPEDGVFGECRKAGLGQLAWSPLAMGVLAGRYTSAAELPSGSRATKPEGRWMARLLNEDTVGAVNAARALADDAGISLAQLALVWALERPGMSSVVVGASSERQLSDTVKAAELTPDPGLLAEYDRLLSPVAIR